MGDKMICLQELMIKLLGGYTKNEYKNQLECIPNEVFEIGDEVYFFYVSKSDNQVPRYYKSTIQSITSEHTKDGVTIKYFLDTSKIRANFDYDFNLTGAQISKTKIGLRNKIINSDLYCIA